MSKSHHNFVPRSRFTAEEHQNFGLYLKALREKSGVKQAELAAKLGHPQSHISRIEAGSRWVGVLEFIAWCRALGVDSADVLKGYDPTT